MNEDEAQTYFLNQSNNKSGMDLQRLLFSLVGQLYIRFKGH